MKLLFTTALILIGLHLSAQAPLPITSYDYAIPENNVSAIAIGMGAMNVTNTDDPFASFSNPALLANGESTQLFTSFRLANDKDITFWEAAQISNFLRDKQFKYFTLVAKQAAFSYQPVAKVNISAWNAAQDSSKYFDYQLDKVQISLGVTDKNWPDLSGGLNLKYLSGRLVYLSERKVGTMMVREAFIDDKVKGFSTDLGLTYKTGDVIMGVTAYDLISRLWWENYPSKSIQRRIGIGSQYGTGSSKVMMGVQSKISKTPDTTYHIGYVNTFNWDSTDFSDNSTIKQGLDIRVGVYSKDFYGTDNINFTLGGGYYYKLFRFDFSLNNSGLRLADSEYLFALGAGF
ncbi:MAG TPA: hypothetical protein PL188_08015 [Candidatus Cloacimonadota bacterium]|nr:hypothetical protein [Candidatus Cloacimonadota bacterium]